MNSATARIVVSVTSRDKRAITANAARSNMSVSELMRQGALAFEVEGQVDELDALAGLAERAADRACAAIDDAADFVRTSNVRIAAMEAAAHKTRPACLEEVDAWMKAVLRSGDTAVRAQRARASQAPSKRSSN